MTRALKWRIAIGLVLVFFAGIATGVFAGARHARHRFVVRHGEVGGDRMREHFKRHLDLTPEQLQHVGPILDQTAEKLHAIRTETSQRVGETMEDAHRRVAPHLTPEQMAKVEKMKQRHIRTMHGHGHHRRHPREH